MVVCIALHTKLVHVCMSVCVCAAKHVHVHVHVLVDARLQLRR